VPLFLPVPQSPSHIPSILAVEWHFLSLPPRPAGDNENEIIPLIDARKERVYYKYQGKCQDDYLINLLSSLDKNKKYVFVGDGAINYADILKENL